MTELLNELPQAEATQADLAFLLQTIADFKTQLAQQANEITALKQQIKQPDAAISPIDSSHSTSLPEMSDTRRKFIKRWGAAAAGLVAGAGALAATTSTAQAANGSNLVLGTNTNTATNQTYLRRLSGALGLPGGLLAVDDNPSGTPTNSSYALSENRWGNQLAITAPTDVAIVGTSYSYNSNAGVYGCSTGGVFGAGVVGYSAQSQGAGVVGLAPDGEQGVYGYAHGSDHYSGLSGNGVVGESITATGTLGATKTGFAGVYGTVNLDPYETPQTKSYGGAFNSPFAPLYLMPNNHYSAGAPTTNNHKKGEFYVDVNGTLWYCKADGSATTSGTWVNLSSTTQFYPFSQPDRFFDSRPNNGASLNSYQIHTLYLNQIGLNNSQSVIPTNARAVTGTFNLIPSSTAADGSIVKVFPSNANVHAVNGAGAVSTALTIGPGKVVTTPLFLPLPNGYTSGSGFSFGVWSNTPGFHMFIDLFGYYL